MAESSLLPPADNLSPLTARLAERGAWRELAGNTPVLLNDPERVFLVVAGTVELFLVNVADGEPSGARQFFATVEAGGLLLGFDSSEDGEGWGILAVAHVGTRVIEAPHDVLEAAAARPDLVAELSRGLDAWVRAVARGLARWVSPRPVVGQAIVPSESASLPADRRCTARGGVAWLTLQAESVLFLDTQDLPDEDGPAVFPLSPEAWLLAVQDVEVTSCTTAQVLADGRAWRGLAALHHLLFETAEMNLRLADVDEYNRLRARVASTERERAGSLADLLSVVDPRRREEAATAADEDPLVVAVRAIGRHEGFDVRVPAAAGQGDGERRPSLTDLAHASGFRVREIVLDRDWWRSDFGALLAFDSESGAPLAVLADWNGGLPRIVDPASGERPIGQGVERVAPKAFALTGPLPLRPLTLRDLPRFAFPRGWRDGLGAVAAGAVGGILGMAVPVATGYLIDTVIPGHDRGQLVEMGMILVVLGLTTFITHYVGAIAFNRFDTRVGAAMQAALIDRVMRLPVTFFRDYTAGDLASRVMAISQIQKMMSGSAASAIMGGVFSLFSFGLMFVYDSHLAGWACLATLTYVLLTLALAFLRLRLERPLATMDGQVESLLLQLITGIAKIRLSASEDRAFARWAHLFAASRRLRQGAMWYGSAQSVLNSLFGFAALILFMAMVGRPEAGGKMIAVGAFSAFLSAFENFNQSATHLASVATQLIAVKPLIERARPILQTQPELHDTKEDPGILSGEVEMSHISFRYAADGPLILDDVSITVAPGEFVALVGGSGAGKSTLLRLVLGFEAPETGGVLIDGRDLRNLDAPAVRRQMGVVMQALQPMPGSLFDNIAGAAGASLADAWEAAEKVGLAEDIREMPMGMHTAVLEGGGSLSGGQTQRLMIARAIVGRPKILLLDEATSALDNRSQAIVSDSLDRLSVTRIVVAHRLSTVVNADRIYVMENGRIVETGTFKDLMAAGGAFARLAERQMV